MIVSSLNGPLRYNPANPRYFTDNSDTAIFLTGSHTWATMQDMWLETEPRKNFDYDVFLQMLEDYGHNFLRFWQWPQLKKAAWTDVDTIFDPMPYQRTGTGIARDGLPKFDLTKWNEDYFTRLRDRVEKAGAKGIYVSVMFFDTWGIKWAKTEDQNPWPYFPMHPDNNINGVTDNPEYIYIYKNEICSLNCPQLLYWQKEFIKKVIATVNDLDNVLYEISNEMPDGPEAYEWAQHLCDFVKEYEKTLAKQHPVGITSGPGYPENEDLINSNADWISPSCGSTFEYRYSPPAADGRKVIITDTDHLWGHGIEVQWIWKSVVRGLNPIFMDPWEPIPVNGDAECWQDESINKNQRYYYSYDIARRNMGYTRKMLQRMNLNRCTPCTGIITSDYCLADPGREYLCYLPAGGTEGISLRGFEGVFEVEWLNPTTGKTYKGKTLKGGDSHPVKAPFEGPSVLYIYKGDV